MTNQRFHKAISELKSVRLTPEAKLVMRERILRTPPVALPIAPPLYRGRVRSPWWNAYSITFAALLVVVLGGAGAVSAAKGSLPGQALYAFKTGVVEPIRGGLAIGAKAKAQFESSLVDVRLAEAETLIKDGKLDSDTRAKINTLINKHGRKYGKAIVTVQADISVEQAVEIDEDFQAKLDFHATKLSTLSIEADAIAPAVATMTLKTVTEVTNMSANEDSTTTSGQALSPALLFDIYSDRPGLHERDSGR